LRFTRPFDNGGTSNISANGVGSQTSEFTLDGIPDNVAFGRQVAYVPPAEAVQEFEVVTSSFDAQNGHSAGAHINIVTRGGANRPAGSIYWFNRNEALAANEFFVKANPDCPRDADGTARRIAALQPLWRDARRAVVWPGRGGLQSGKDRLFFFVAYEGLRQTTPQDTFTVPTAAMRNGDFSALLPNIVIYIGHRVRQCRRTRGAYTVRETSSRPSASVIGRNYLSYWHCRIWTAPCAMPRQSDRAGSAYRSLIPLRRGHEDHQQARFFARYSYNHREQQTEGWSGVIRAWIRRPESFGSTILWPPIMSMPVVGLVAESARRVDAIRKQCLRGEAPTYPRWVFLGHDGALRDAYFPQFNVTNLTEYRGGTVGGARSGEQI
jgi:hypothetical protein